MPLKLISNTTTLLVISLLVISFYLIGCKEKTSEKHSFFKRPINEQHKVFIKLPIDKQLELYLYAVTERHPPDLSFATDIANSGEKNLHFLIGELKKNKADSIQQKLIYIFEMIAMLNKYDFRSNNELITLLKAITTNMQQPLYKERCEQSLKIILGKTVETDTP